VITKTLHVQSSLSLLLAYSCRAMIASHHALNTGCLQGTIIVSRLVSTPARRRWDHVC